MTFYNENVMHNLGDILNLSMYARCTELSLFFDRCDIRELTEVFPIVVKSIFGLETNNIGWGLRTTTKENAGHSFTAIEAFMDPLGPMFRVCYRLLDDAIKFDFSLDLLPRKMVGMMQSGASALFYGDLVNIDPFQRRVASLSLNAFDYFMLHFIRHATLPLHRHSPIALQVHNELLKSVYFFLTATYLNTFLPGDPNTQVLPSNICSKIKAQQPLPVQQLQPQRVPKYLKVPNTMLYTTGNSPAPIGKSACVLSPIDCNNESSPKSNYWRTESVLNFFLDTWLRHDVEEARDLPSTDFIRVVRILVKQVHSFGNSTCMDTTSMASIRKVSQIMLKHRIYPFLKSLISRWPLDDSLLVVLELWFSYIQPWRYSFEIVHSSKMCTEIPMQPRFEIFISDNLPLYTQIFIDVLFRFTRLDFTSTSNVNMLHRLARVFSQSTLHSNLYKAEKALSENSFPNDSPQRRSTTMRNYSVHMNSSSISDLESTSYLEAPYVLLFSPQKAMEIKHFLENAYVSRQFVVEEIKKIKHEIEKIHKTYSLFKQLVVFLIGEELPLEKQLNQLLKIPYILENSINDLSRAFKVDMSSISENQIENTLSSPEESSTNMLQQSNSFSSLSSIKKLNGEAKNFMKSIDPALIPIQNHECTILVRVLHNISSIINVKFGNKFDSFWNRTDFIGKLSRQLLQPPMTSQWFDKPRGITELFSEELPARISLRPIASYRTIAILSIALILGKYFCGSFLCGLFYFLSSVCFYIIIMSTLN